MAKTLAQGRKPGSGRKPGKGKTLREGRKPGSGRRRRRDNEQESAVRDKSQSLISSRDLEAVDALRELNNSPPQLQPQEQQQRQETEVAQEAPVAARSLVAPSVMIPSLAQTSGPGSFAFHSVGPYMIAPQYMHTTTSVTTPLLVSLRNSGSPSNPSNKRNNEGFTKGRSSSGDDTTGNVLIHTST